MFEDNHYITKFTDLASEGLIFIDKEGKIQLYNKRAKEIFGIIYNQGRGHREGRIEEGDIVIIADNYLGRDDGGLRVEDLEKVGIDDNSIELGDSIIAIGVYNRKYIKPVYRFQKNNKKKLQMNTSFLDISIEATIDPVIKNINISINDESFEMEYINALGHMVILDGETKEVKFYQAKGYTIRKESVNDILKGKTYRAKGEDSEIIDVIGKDIFDIHGFIADIKDFNMVARGKDLSYKDKFIEINGRPTLCSLIPLDMNGKRVGAMLKVEDITELRRISRERDEALSRIVEMEKKLNQEENISKLFPNIIGESKKIKNVKNLLFKASKSNSTVLILGESGTGKSLIAKEIHNVNKGTDKPFINVNCASIPETLIESELFGYEAGAFTGAKYRGKKGYFEIAHGGTIFLDEIGEINSAMQVKLLQVIQNRSFFRVGGIKKIKVDLRIIAATNKNLEKEVIEGRFREDLFYRINVFPIWIPPLRERKEDIHYLVYSSLPKICKKVGTQNKNISGEALKKLNDYDWPGNVRELENVLERAVNLCEGNTIFSKHIPIGIKASKDYIGRKKITTLKEAINKAEREVIIEALEESKGNKGDAMKLLGIGKTSFYEKLKKYNIVSSQMRK